MCDTIVALGNSTRNGVVLFGKNSDREADEVQNLVFSRGGSHSSDETVKCTYIEIPQVEETYDVLLSQPFWMFGGEMGVNEWGVVIGNEALFTRVKSKKSHGGLTGMDLLRLALERSKSAEEARDTIIHLLEQYGQGGNCGYRHSLYYMNGFLIADSKHAYVLETVERMWAWKKVSDVWSISNTISITTDFDSCSDDLISYALSRGWCKSSSEFNFHECYSDKFMTWGAAGRIREARTRELLLSNKGNIDVALFMSILRDHGPRSPWEPSRGGLRMTVCAHASNNLTRISQTVNSLIVSLSPSSSPLCLTTGSSNPCISPYFPVGVKPSYLPHNYKKGSESYSPESYWWLSEEINRSGNLCYPLYYSHVKSQISKYENEMLMDVQGSLSSSGQVSSSLIDKWFDKAVELRRSWRDSLHNGSIEGFSRCKIKRSYYRYWEKYNKKNGVSFLF